MGTGHEKNWRWNSRQRDSSCRALRGTSSDSVGLSFQFDRSLVGLECHEGRIQRMKSEKGIRDHLGLRGHHKVFGLYFKGNRKPIYDSKEGQYKI